MINKGWLYRNMVFASAGIVSCSCNNPSGNGSGPLDKYKNVVVLIGDDHASTVLGCYGNEVVHTPNIDSLAKQGVCFINAYSNAPVCSASRQSLLTGKYPHATGVSLLTTPFPDSGNITMAEIFRDHGYKTGVIGKTHFNQYEEDAPDHGFEYKWTHGEYNWWREKYADKVPDSITVRPVWKPFQDPARVWLNADVLPAPYFEGHGTADIDANKAIDFINRNKDKKFFLWVGFTEPHSPFDFPVEYRKRYKPGDFELPEGSPEDDRWVPEVFKDLSTEEKKGIIASYYTSVEYLDKNVGKIVDEIKTLGLTDETLVVYLGDQGYLLGEHKRFEKHTMWEEAIKAPLIMAGGKNIQKGKKTNALVEFIDLAPTIMDLVDLPKIEDFQGKSMLPVLLGESNSHKVLVFSEYLEDNKAMVATEKWKYIFTTGKKDLGQGYATGYGPSGILHKLYNLENDPGESVNVAGNPDNEVILEHLQNEMLKVFMETHPEANDLPPNLSVEKKLAWFCEPRDVGNIVGAK